MKAFLRAWLAAWVLRRQGPDALPVMLRRRRLYIVPTRAGLGFALALLCMLLAGLNYANSLALFLTFLLAGFAFVCMHLCHRNLLHLGLLHAATAPAFADEHGGVQLLLGNESRLPRYGLEIDALGQFAPTVDVPAHGNQGVTLPVHAPRRGLIRIERLRLMTTYPCGLFRAWTWVHLPLTMTVYPRPRGNRPLPSAGAPDAGRQLRGAAGDDEWLSLRLFREGDSPRQVAWKAYARGAPLLVREYAAAGAQLRRLDFAQLPHLDTERRLEQLARWVLDAEAAGERYALTLPGVQITADHGAAHRHRCLNALALHGLDGRAG